MSNLLVGQVFQLDLEPSLKLVLMGLADSADDRGGSCFPAVRTIARKASISTRQAQRNLKVLREESWCFIESHQLGGRHTRRYRINTEKLREKSDEAMRGDKLSPLKKGPDGCRRGHRWGDAGGIPAVTSTSSNLPTDLSDETTTAAGEPIWPRNLNREQVVVIKKLIEKLEPAQRQMRLDELAGAMDKRQPPDDPISWLRAIVVGPFTPNLCLKVAAERERRAREAEEYKAARAAAAEANRRRSDPVLNEKSEAIRNEAIASINAQLRRSTQPATTL